jgi:hypothetical protein
MQVTSFVQTKILLKEMKIKIKKKIVRGNEKRRRKENINRHSIRYMTMA